MTVTDPQPPTVDQLVRRPFLSPKQVALALGLSERTVRGMLAVGRIRSYKVEGARRIDPRDVDAYLEGCDAR